MERVVIRPRVALDADGGRKTSFDTTVAEENPRTAIGYYEPGHYCIVIVNGRGTEGSRGYTMSRSPPCLRSWAARRHTIWTEAARP